MYKKTTIYLYIYIIPDPLKYTNEAAIGRSEKLVLPRFKYPSAVSVKTPKKEEKQAVNKLKKPKSYSPPKKW